MLGDKISRGDSFCEEGVALSLFFVFLSRFICLYSICLSTLTKNRKYLCKIVSFLLYHSLDFDKNCLNNARNNKQMPYFR